MDELVQWLGEQLDEDERIARAAGGRIEIDYHWFEVSSAKHPGVVGTERGLLVTTDRALREHAAHIAAHDPARVLREIDAKRAIVDEHVLTVEKVDAAPYDSFTGERRSDVYDVTCAVCGWANDDRTSGCRTLRLLASVYSDRPGYRQEWSQ